MSVIDLSPEEVKPKFPHPNTEAEQQQIEDITTWVNKAYDKQNRTWHEFNDRSLLDYGNDNEKRINSYVPPRDEELDDWQTIGFEGVTREKMFAFVAKVAMSRPKMKMVAINADGVIDRMVADAIDTVFQFSYKQEDPTEIKFLLEAWLTAGHGTSIRFEGVEREDCVEQKYESFNIKTGEVEGLEETEEEGDINATSRMVRLGDFLIDDWYQPDIQKQTRVAEVERMTIDSFKNKYGEYKNADAVPAVGDISAQWGEGFFVSQWSNEENDKVVVLHFYEKVGKKRYYRVIANGVMIASTPILRRDGKFPFARKIFKPFADVTFFYGKAMPDEIAWDQDIYNAFKNMVVDRAILHINRPLITDGNTEITDLVLAPNKVLNIKGNVQPMNYPPPDQNDMQILQFLRGSMDRQTSDAQQSGQVEGGATARGIVIADENARKLAGIFRKFLEQGEWEASKLRLGTIQEYYFEPTGIKEMEEIIGEKKSKAIYRTFVMDGQKLSDGVNGTKVIHIYGNREDRPTEDELTADAMFAKSQGMEMEKMALNANYIKEFDIEVIVIPESSIEQSRSLNLALQNEYMQTMATLFPQKFQQFSDIFFRDLNETYEKDMSQFESQEQNQPEQAPQPGLPGQPTAAPQSTQQSAASSLSQLGNL
jgi:hypothetical protein